MRRIPEGPRTEKVFELSHPVVFGPLQEGEFEAIRMNLIRAFNAIGEIDDRAWKVEPKLEQEKFRLRLRATYYGKNPFTETFVAEKLAPLGVSLEDITPQQ